MSGLFTMGTTANRALNAAISFALFVFFGAGTVRALAVVPDPCFGYAVVVAGAGATFACLILTLLHLTFIWEGRK